MTVKETIAKQIKRKVVTVVALVGDRYCWTRGEIVDSLSDIGKVMIRPASLCCLEAGGYKIVWVIVCG